MKPRRAAPGPTLYNVNLEASAFHSVGVEMDIERVTAAGAPPVAFRALRFYWARAEDIVGQEWPFSAERSVPIGPVKEAPGVFAGVMERHPMWSGPIARVFIGVDVMEERLGPNEFYRVQVKRIAFRGYRNTVTPVSAREASYPGEKLAQRIAPAGHDIEALLAQAAVIKN